MAADKAQRNRGFVTAAQSLQHLATNARLGDARHGAHASEAASTKVYQQSPRDDGTDDGVDDPYKSRQAVVRQV